MMREENAKKISSCILWSSIFFIILGILLALSLGAKRMNPDIILKSLFAYENTLDDQLIRNVRLPRAICAAIVGAVLGVSGAMMQGVTRNPITEPSVMGITQGATLAIAIAASSDSIAGLFDHMGAAYLGAMLSGSFVLVFSLHKKHKFNPSRLVLAGTALSTFFISLASAIALLTNRSQELAFWVSGGFRTADWTGALVLGVIGSLGIFLAVILSPRINTVSLGDEVAVGLGEKPARVKLYSFLLLIPMCAAAVAVAGNISFVGLIIPQIAQKFVGQDYKRIIPCSAVLGAVLLTYSDIAARLVNIPYETPVGLFTALIGVPFFLILLRREKLT